LRKRVDLLLKEIQNLTNAVAEGRAVKSVMAALQEREQEQEALQRELDRLTITAGVE
jgi:cell shape-determining protein MreC